ncbi:MAG TPA: VWA domain-containing protein [Vicinamibacterales bacterium]|nr:VWA domain-containing protein [Vicinamibacterales bacterium]
MTLKANGFWSTAMLVGLAVGLSAQAPAPTAPQPQTAKPPETKTPETKPQEKPTFKVQVDLVTNDVMVRDAQGNFVPDLTKDDFEVYEDGVKQDIVSMTLSHGGRVTNVMAPPPPPPPEGIILPPSRPKNDVSGRIFLFFVDDLHLQFHNTGRVRELFRKISKQLVHEGDMFGIVSSGPSSIAVDMTYDRSRLDEAIKKMAGNELKPTDIINGPSGSDGPSEVKYRAHVAFSTVSDVLTNLEQVHNRRKALVYVSDGYDFNPFQDARLGLMDPNSPFAQNEFARGQNQANAAAGQSTGPDAMTQAQQQGEEFADADLARELGDLTRAANRANATIYTIDPRGLVGGSDIDEQVDPTQWNDYIRKPQDSLRVLADETGGIAVVNQNDFDKALKKIDADSSDYYVLGYYSKNPDPTKRRRSISVKATQQGVALSVVARKEYVLRPPPKPVSSTKK